MEMQKKITLEMENWFSKHAFNLGRWKSPSLWLFCILFITANNLKTWQFSNFKLQISFKSANNLKTWQTIFQAPRPTYLCMEISFAYFAIFSYDLIYTRTFCIYADTNNNRVIISKQVYVTKNNNKELQGIMCLFMFLFISKCGCSLELITFVTIIAN